MARYRLNTMMAHCKYYRQKWVKREFHAVWNACLPKEYYLWHWLARLKLLECLEPSASSERQRLTIFVRLVASANYAITKVLVRNVCTCTYMYVKLPSTRPVCVQCRGQAFCIWEKKHQCMTVWPNELSHLQQNLNEHNLSWFHLALLQTFLTST